MVERFAGSRVVTSAGHAVTIFVGALAEAVVPAPVLVVEDEDDEPQAARPMLPTAKIAISEHWFMARRGRRVGCDMVRCLS